MKFKRLISIFLASSLLTAAPAAFAAGRTANEEPVYSGEYEAFDLISTYISEQYIDDTLSKEEIKAQGLSKLLEDDEDLLIRLLKATLSEMDDYSEFYTPEEYLLFETQFNRTFYGIGITMHQNEGELVEVTDFAPGNDNAKNAGIEIGDKIYKVNGEDMTGLVQSEVRSRIVGEEGTTVNITMLRGDEEVEIEVTRVAVNQMTVQDTILDDNIGYIQITTFNSSTASEFEKALDTMRENNVKNIILDLRNNTGGLVSAAVKIAQSVVPKGTIIDVKYRNSEYDVTYKSDLKAKEFNFAVLVNENTASASEILASAMQDSDAAKLVGTTTYGKAVIQNTFELSNGSMFKLTVGKYITRSGKEINHVGLTPDIYAENEITKIDASKYTPLSLTKPLSLGSYGDDVKALKERLCELDYYNGDTEDPVFGEDLKSAVTAFQQENDIFSYGAADLPTQSRIDELFRDINVLSDNQFTAAKALFAAE